MSSENKDGFAFLKSIFNNPKVKAGLAVASIALFLRHKDFVDNDQLREHIARKQAEHEKVQRDAEQRSRRTKAYNAYLFNGGPGEDKVRKLGMVTVGPGEPLADARYENTSGDWRNGRTSLRVTSRQAGAELEGGWNNREGHGGLRLTYADGSFWSLPTFGVNGTHQYIGTEGDLNPPLKPGQRPLFDLEAAALAARLLTTATNKPEKIKLYRPDYYDIRRRAWRDYMLANPELAADLGRSATEEEDRARFRAKVEESARRRANPSTP